MTRKEERNELQNRKKNGNSNSLPIKNNFTYKWIISPPKDIEWLKGF